MRSPDFASPGRFAVFSAGRLRGVTLDATVETGGPSGPVRVSSVEHAHDIQLIPHTCRERGLEVFNNCQTGLMMFSVNTHTRAISCRLAFPAHHHRDLARAKPRTMLEARGCKWEHSTRSRPRSGFSSSVAQSSTGWRQSANRGRARCLSAFPRGQLHHDGQCQSPTRPLGQLKQKPNPAESEATRPSPSSSKIYKYHEQLRPPPRVTPIVACHGPSTAPPPGAPQLRSLGKHSIEGPRSPKWGTAWFMLAHAGQGRHWAVWSLDPWRLLFRQ